MTNPTPMGSPLWIAAGWTMFHFLWIGATLGLSGLLGRRALDCASLEVRYGFALFILAAMAVAPAVTFALVYTPSLPESPTRKISEPNALVSETIRHAQHSTPSSKAQSTSPAGSREQRQSLVNTIVRNLPWLWLAGSPVTFALLTCGLIGAERYKRNSRMIDWGEIPLLCHRLVRALRIAREVAVGVCDQIAAPVLIGILRPVILLPPTALSGWTIEQLEMVLCHELAHLRRWDNLINFIQRIVESLLFFHPAVWWVSAWVRLEREYCCDLIVVETTGRPRAYVETLATLAGARARHRTPLAMALAESQVVARIRRILEFHDHHMTMKLSRLAVVGAAALILGPIFAVGVWASFTDRLVDGDRGSPTELAQVPATTTPDRAIPNRRRGPK